jgi:CheY-like chemotaxis protein
MLKILIVEDSQNKANEVKTFLESIHLKGEYQIDVVPDYIGAKKNLKDINYNILILDLQIPQRFGDSPDVDGGQKLINEVSKREKKFNKPEHIIGLSSYSESIKKHSDFFRKHLSHILEFDDQSWKSIVEQKVLDVEQSINQAHLEGTLSESEVTEQESLQEIKGNSDSSLLSFLKTVGKILILPAIGFIFLTVLYPGLSERYSVIKSFIKAEKLFISYDRDLDLEIKNSSLIVVMNRYITQLNTLNDIFKDNAKILREAGSPVQVKRITHLASMINLVKDNFAKNLPKLENLSDKEKKLSVKVIRVQNENLKKTFDETKAFINLDYISCKKENSVLYFYKCINPTGVEENDFPYWLIK